MTSLADTFSALGDTTRFAIVDQLLRDGETSAGRLTEMAGLSAPAVSRHLKVLRNAGLIRQRVQGTHRIYAVEPEAMRAIGGWTMAHKDFWMASLDRLDMALKED